MHLKMSWRQLLIIFGMGLALAGVLFNCSKGAVLSESETVMEEPAAEAEVTADAMYSVATPQKKEKKAQHIETWKRSQLVAHTSQLKIGDDETLPLKGLQINVQIDGYRARVILDAFYFNDRDRAYEGTFQLRLPEGAIPYFFAFGETVTKVEQKLDQPVFFNPQQSQTMGDLPAELMQFRNGTWSKPKEARMVPRAKAAYAYHETVRSKIDPALMEWSGAGVFSARVFPLAPDKLHRIVFGYDVDLMPVGNDWEYRLDLPAKIPRMIIDLKIDRLPGVAVEIQPDGLFSSTADKDADNVQNYIYRRLEDPNVSTVTVRMLQPGTMVLSGSDQKTGGYFAVNLKPQLLADPAQAATQHAVFLVDVSLSSNPDRFNIWVKLLNAILSNNQDVLTHFSVCFFNIETFWWREKFVLNIPENVQTLMQYAKGLSLEGATDVGSALREASRPAWLSNQQSRAQWDIFLLSDGAATWGQSELFAISQPIKTGGVNALFAYQTGLAGTDMRALNHLARESGGAVFTVVSEDEVMQASRAHRAEPWHIKHIRVEGGSDVLVAGRPSSIFPGQILKVAGRGQLETGAAFVLTVFRREREKVLRIAPDHFVNSTLAPGAYGHIAVMQLEDFGSQIEDIATAYATHFRVTGKTTSLLMLESEEDYQRFNIRPEANAFVVKTQPVSEAVARVLAKIGDALGDPKAAFEAWLEKIEKLPHLRFETSTAFRLALDQMPAEYFQVGARPLDIKLRRWQDVPAKVRKQLSSQKLKYDTITREADRRNKSYGPADALRVLSSLMENNPGDSVVARDVAYSASAYGLPGHAYHLFRRVAAARPYEPQTYRAMAQVLELLGKTDLAMVYYEVGLRGNWDPRFGEFRRIHSIDYLRFLKKVNSGKLRSSVPDFTRLRYDTLQQKLDLKQTDLLIAITWNTDRTDVDLHVVEPGGEECYYENRTTRSGGSMTQDVTQGYGPEMYTLPNAKSGAYKIRVKYFSQDASRASTRTKVAITVIEGWGTQQERTTRKTVTLRHGKQMHDLMTVKFSK
jgi:hypothetical protein